MDAVTIIGLCAVALMFAVGAGLLWVGLHRRSARLPEGAEEVIQALLELRLEHPTPPEPLPERRPTEEAEQETITIGTASSGLDLREEDDDRDEIDEEELTASARAFFAKGPELTKF